ncbi:MAG: ArsR family transcriptional regulator [Desulfurococcaceae archaeon]
MNYSRSLINLTEDEIRYFSRKVENMLNKLYEDSDVVLMTAPNEDVLKSIILEILEERPMNLKEIHAVLSGLASEDKIRKALLSLTDGGKIHADEVGKFRILGSVK